MVKPNKIVRAIEAIAHYLLYSLTSVRVALLFGGPLYRLTGRWRNAREIRLTEVRRVLLVRLDLIGDMVLTTPLLRELRRNLPGAWITLVARPQVYNLIELCPYVNEVLTYDWNGPRWIRPLVRHYRALRLAWGYLWPRRFDLAILPRWSADHYHGTFLVYFSGAYSRVAYSEDVDPDKKRLNHGFDRLITHPIICIKRPKHEVENNLEILRFLGGRIERDQLELWLEKEDEMFAESVLDKHGVKPSDLLIGVGPGASVPKRRWPLCCFAEIGLWLMSKYNARILLVGGSAEGELGYKLERDLGRSVINTIGRVTLRQGAALVRRCQLYLGNDTGPMHIAAAVGVSVVVLSCHPKSGSPFCPNSPKRFGPWGDKHIVLQPENAVSPCEDECVAERPHCIVGIAGQRVKEAVVWQLGKENSRDMQKEHFWEGRLDRGSSGY